MFRVHDMKKGQLFSTELVLASAIFITAIIVFVAVWNAMLSSYYEEQADREMQAAVLGVSDMMALSPGEPSNWEAALMENASAFGLASSPNAVSTHKMQAMESMNATRYSTLKERMGAGRFDIFMAVNNSTATVFTFGQIGNTSDPALRSFTVQRLVTANGSVFTLRVQAWRYRGNAA